ncbi:MAG TPA: polysaccharide deacetylase family protein [Solirubrobacteraceae bacterium]|nr:polysaccharide deacetylase family protein [Solirubrobacteraceae bacterium]
MLEREHVPATFFVIGSRARGNRALLKRMLRGGSTIANHTLTHANVAGAGAFAAQQIAATQSIIHHESGFKPCLFRPPYGASRPALSDVVRSFGALSILWDVDSNDRQRPGTATIVADVLRQTRPGSIILMHDGGRDRSQTVAALPTIIRELRRRGLRFVTVEQLLGLRLIGAAGSRRHAALRG